MNDAAANMAKDWLTLALAGIGISFPAHHFLGGLFMAFAGAALAAKWQPEQDRRELWLVMMGAFFASAYKAKATAGAESVAFSWPDSAVRKVWQAIEVLRAA